jgi:2-polyprenyl-3-methyl-5-hydroxy-6-metoxy-1,4-benzoquinol methylase
LTPTIDVSRCSGVVLRKKDIVTLKPQYKHVRALLVVILGFAGCAEWNYPDMTDPSRDVWQKPQGVIKTLSIAPGSRVADLGADAGYFTWYLAKAVGSRGTVYAVDIEERAINMIFKEMVARGSQMSDRSVPNYAIQDFRSRSTSCSAATPIIL